VLGHYDGSVSIVQAIVSAAGNSMLPGLLLAPNDMAAY
jgi:hypothetical protein